VKYESVPVFAIRSTLWCLCILPSCSFNQSAIPFLLPLSIFNFMLPEKYILQMDFSDFRTLCKFILSKFFLIFKSFDFVVT